MNTTNITATGAVSAATLSSSGNATIGGTLGVTGAATFSNTLNATGNITSTNNLYANGGKLYLNSKLAADGKTTANTLVINGSGNFSEGTYIKNKLKSDTLDATTLSATTLSASSASFSGDVTVNGVLNSNEMQTNIVKAVGGQLYVSPTYVAGTSATIACTNSDASYVWFTISDSAITGLAYGGANWYSGSKIMFTGVVKANLSGQPDIVFASSPGELTANMNASNNNLQIKVKYDKASTYFSSAGTNLTWSDMSVMMYQINNSGTLYPIGVYIKAYGNDNKNSYIDIYGGTSATTSARLGLLDGVPAMANGTTPTGWGIYTNHGYFDGTIVSNSGTIGNFTLGDDLRSGTWGTSGSVLVSPGYSPSNAESVSIGGSPATGNTWAFTSGNNFGVTTSGSLYASSANISGTISAGANSTIGPWSVTATSIYKGNATMGSATTGAAYFGDNGLSITDKFKVTAAGLLSATGADISGEIHASSGSTFGDTNGQYLQINNASLDLYNSTINIMHIGYGEGIDRNGNISYAPYFTFGERGTGDTPYVGNYSMAIGEDTVAEGFCSFAQGHSARAVGSASHAEGYSTEARTSCSHAEGYMTIATGYYSHSEGYNSQSHREACHAEGYNTFSGNRNDSEYVTYTNNGTSASIGSYPDSSPSYCHAEGYYTKSYGEASHSEGGSTVSFGDYSHVEGFNSKAYGDKSHAQNDDTRAYGKSSHASGKSTVATAEAQTVIGKYNTYTEDDSADPSIFDAGDYAFIIGNGTADNARSNALTVDWSGNLITAGDITANGSPVITQADVVNVLTSTSTTAPLSAAQGKALNDKEINRCAKISLSSANVTNTSNAAWTTGTVTRNVVGGTNNIYFAAPTGTYARHIQVKKTGWYLVSIICRFNAVTNAGSVKMAYLWDATGNGVVGTGAMGRATTWEDLSSTELVQLTANHYYTFGGRSEDGNSTVSGMQISLVALPS